MEFFRFTQDNGKKVNHFHSDFVISRIAEIQDKAQISCMYLQQNGVIGYHEAVVNQLLFVVSGEGFVCDEQRQYIKIQAGDAVFWQQGEWHETKTNEGLTAIVIESETLHPQHLGWGRP